MKHTIVILSALLCIFMQSSCTQRQEGDVRTEHYTLDDFETVEMKDSIHYNQVSGKEMKAYFVDGDMRHIEVTGNVLTAFYPEEKDSTMTGFNYLEGSVLHLYLRERKMERGVFVGKSNGTMYPMDQIPPDKLRLPAFVWLDYIRPLSKEDIFHWRGKKSDQILKPTTVRRPETDRRSLINM